MTALNARVAGTVRQQIVDKPAQNALKPVSTGIKKSPKASSPPKRKASPNVFGKRQKPRKGSKAAKAAEILRNGNFFSLDKLASPAPKPYKILSSDRAPQQDLTPEQLGARVLANRKRQENVENCLKPMKCLDLPPKKVVPTGTVAPKDKCAKSLKNITGFKFLDDSAISARTLTSLATACGFEKRENPAYAHSRVQEFLFEAADRCVRSRGEYLCNTAADSETHFYIRIYNQLRRRYKDDDSIDITKMGPVELRELMDALVIARFAFMMEVAEGDMEEETRLTYIADRWDGVWGQKKRM
ncbi:hypothetical protein CkaCkLH20_05269 [Colletotrichum karsti]|uniref:Uncharacterized protein n=1 Tax=Colletotrichum karsti TaxID=1095194 RepID=A0A9P6LKQ9_9PEZI|nr:uncharacterized protein CkaCkLH20_05269 [Colletotrichum karsti]KAF9877003.1 hypothetical protein CkaCkLH20_05269 [Colletotrichum karsti]